MFELDTMIPSIAKTILLLATLSATSAPAQEVPATSEPSPQEDFAWKPGQLLPDLELPRIDGSGSVRLSSLRGSRVILIQFASW